MFAAADTDMPQVVRHHTVIVGVVSGLVLTIAVLAVCATCQQSRHERRRLHKLSTTAATTATEDEPASTHQRATQLTNVDDHRIHDVTSAPTAQNHQPHGWTALANGGQCIQRDDGLSAASSGLTGIRQTPDIRPHTSITELPVDELSAVGDRTFSRARKLSNISNTAGPPSVTNMVMATIEKRPTSPATDGDRGVRPPSPRPDVVQYDKFQYVPSRSAQQTAVEARRTDTSPESGRRICPGWSSFVTPAAATSASGPLVRPNCIQSVPDRQWQQPASMRWTGAHTMSSSRRPEMSGAAMYATRSTSELYDDVRPRLGATHSIVF